MILHEGKRGFVLSKYFAIPNKQLEHFSFFLGENSFLYYLNEYSYSSSGQIARSGWSKVIDSFTIVIQSWYRFLFRFSQTIMCAINYV